MSGSAQPKLRLVVTDTTKAVLLANLVMKGAAVVNETGISIEMKRNGTTFFIPQPLIENSYYSTGQLEEIETSLNGVGIDLLPIDHNCAA